MELGAGEILVILAIVLLLFGPSKLPKLGEGLGSAMANFRKALRGDEPTATAEETQTTAATPNTAATPLIRLFRQKERGAAAKAQFMVHSDLQASLAKPAKDSPAVTR